MTTAESPDNAAILGEVSALRRELSITWKAHEREHEQHDKAHNREHEFTADALKVAAELAKETKRDANEWRAAMDDKDKTLATKADISAIVDRLDKIERAAIAREAHEQERLRADAEAKTLQAREDAEGQRQMERRQARSQWVVGLVVGLIATFGAILVNLVIRLATT